MSYREPFYLLVIGGRDWKDIETEEFELGARMNDLGERLFLIHGDCPTGADSIADRWARFYDVPRLAWPARWKSEDAPRNMQGPIRNGRMCEWLRQTVSHAYGMNAHNYHEVLAFWDGKSTGTEGCIYEAWSRGLNVTIEGPGKDKLDLSSTNPGFSSRLTR